MKTEKRSLQAPSHRIMVAVMLLSSLFLCVAGTTYAESLKTVKHLMNEPATLFDLGIVRLENLLRKNQPAILEVSYDRGRNKIEWLK